MKRRLHVLLWRVIAVSAMYINNPCTGFVTTVHGLAPKLRSKLYKGRPSKSILFSFHFLPIQLQDTRSLQPSLHSIPLTTMFSKIFIALSALTVLAVAIPTPAP